MRFFYLVFYILAVLVFGGLCWWLLSYVVEPALDRRFRRLAAEQERREEIDAMQHEWAKANIQATREDLERHRARLEVGLDDLHKDDTG